MYQKIKWDQILFQDFHERLKDFIILQKQILISN